MDRNFTPLNQDRLSMLKKKRSPGSTNKADIILIVIGSITTVILVTLLVILYQEKIGF